MADVINKQTLEYLKSVNTPDYNSANWIINPVLPDCDRKYWKIASGKVKEMTVSEKATVDQNELDALAERQKEVLIQERMIQINRQQAIDELINEGLL